MLKNVEARLNTLVFVAPRSIHPSWVFKGFRKGCAKEEKGTPKNKSPLYFEGQFIPIQGVFLSQFLF